MVLQGLFTFASSLVIGAVALVGICYTVNYVQNLLQYETPVRPSTSNQSEPRWNGYDSWEPITCTICLTTIDGSSKCELPCGHLFHGRCIVNWVKEKKHCPNCRKPVRI